MKLCVSVDNNGKAEFSDNLLARFMGVPSFIIRAGQY